MCTASIVIGLILVLVGTAGGFPWLLGLGVTSVLGGMARAGGAPRWAAWLLWGWLTAVIWLLPGVLPMRSASDAAPPGGLTGGALLMLVGVWLLPFLIAPLAFLVHFRSWLSE